MPSPSILDRMPLLPGPFFGMVLGVGGLGAAWKVAARVWGYPAAVGDALMLAGAFIWIAWIGLYAGKWIAMRAAARAELADPVASFAMGLAPMATILASIGLKPFLPTVATAVLVAGILAGIVLSAYLIGRAWQGGAGLETVTPLMILPTVGTAYTGAIGAAAFGNPEIATILWGPGVITWMLIDSLILLRLMTHPLPVPLRATIGVQFAPPTVGTLAYLGFLEGPPDKVVHFLIGYALLQAVILVRLNGWIRAQPFSAGAWAFTFGVAAFAVSTAICLERQPAGAIGALAWPAFLFANLFIGYVAARTVVLGLAGRLFPPRPA